MHFVLIILLSTLVLAQEQICVFDYTQVAPCARSCQILAIAELNCVPPVAPISNYVTYIDCFCHSDYIKSLYGGDKICHHVCSDKDVLSISIHYNKLCRLPQLSSFSSFSPTTTVALDPVLTSLANTSTEPPPTSFPGFQDRPKDHGVWLHNKWKYLLVTGVLLFTTFLVIFFLAFFYRRYRSGSNTKTPNANNCAIPLRTLPPSPYRSDTQNFKDSESIENLPSTTPASPLAPLGSAHTFGDSLRHYAQEIREREENLAKRLPRDNGPQKTV
jgi:hypothetical protein